MNPERRADQVAESHEAVARWQARVEQLAPLVGDPEEVVNEHGRLPADRRFSTLYEFRDRRITEGMELRAVVPELEARLKATDDKAERATLRSRRDCKARLLEKLLGVSRLEAEDMCADCVTPAAKHGYVSPPHDYPCPAVAWTASYPGKGRQDAGDVRQAPGARD